VAIGMIAEAEIAEHLGLCDREVVERQRALLSRAGLPIALPTVTFSTLWAAMQHDKKVAAGRIYGVLPERVGQGRIVPIERATLKEWFSRQRDRTPKRVAKV
jgi:3-dehydroquinate synthase